MQISFRNSTRPRAQRGLLIKLNNNNSYKPIPANIVMPLLATIDNYFKKKLPILIDTKPYSYDACIDFWGLIHLHEDHFYPETYNFYFKLLHEFIHLDRERTTGSTNGYGISSGSWNQNDTLEQEVDKESEELINQNFLVFKILKKKLKSANFILESSLERPTNHQTLNAKFPQKS